jgi:hypothetical protein
MSSLVVLTEPPRRERVWRLQAGPSDSSGFVADVSTFASKVLQSLETGAKVTSVE